MDLTSPHKYRTFEQNKSQDIVTYYHLEVENFIMDDLVVNNGTIIEAKTNGSKEDGEEWDRRYTNILINKI